MANPDPVTIKITADVSDIKRQISSLTGGGAGMISGSTSPGQPQPSVGGGGAQRSFGHSSTATGGQPQPSIGGSPIALGGVSGGGGAGMGAGGPDGVSDYRNPFRAGSLGRTFFGAAAGGYLAYAGSRFVSQSMEAVRTANLQAQQSSLSMAKSGLVPVGTGSSEILLDAQYRNSVNRGINSAAESFPGLGVVAQFGNAITGYNTSLERESTYLRELAASREANAGTSIANRSRRFELAGDPVRAGAAARLSRQTAADNAEVSAMMTRDLVRYNWASQMTHPAGEYQEMKRLDDLAAQQIDKARQNSRDVTELNRMEAKADRRTFGGSMRQLSLEAEAVGLQTSAAQMKLSGGSPASIFASQTLAEQKVMQGRFAAEIGKIPEGSEQWRRVAAIQSAEAVKFGADVALRVHEFVGLRAPAQVLSLAEGAQVGLVSKFRQQQESRMMSALNRAGVDVTGTGALSDTINQLTDEMRMNNWMNGFNLMAGI